VYSCKGWQVIDTSAKLSYQSTLLLFTVCWQYSSFGRPQPISSHCGIMLCIQIRYPQNHSAYTQPKFATGNVHAGTRPMWLHQPTQQEHFRIAVICSSNLLKIGCEVPDIHVCSQIYRQTWSLGSILLTIYRRVPTLPFRLSVAVLIFSERTSLLFYNTNWKVPRRGIKCMFPSLVLFNWNFWNRHITTTMFLLERLVKCWQLNVKWLRTQNMQHRWFIIGIWKRNHVNIIHTHEK